MSAAATKAQTRRVRRQVHREEFARDEQDHSHRADRGAHYRDSRRLGRQVGAFEGTAHNVADDVGAVVQACGEACTTAFKGVVSVVSNLVIDLSESAISDRRDDRSHLRTERRRERGLERDEAPLVSGLGDTITEISRSLSEALNATADTIARSGEVFRQRYERSVRSADTEEPDDLHRSEAREERDEAVDQANEAREQQRRETTEHRAKET